MVSETEQIPPESTSIKFNWFVIKKLQQNLCRLSFSVI